MLLRKLFCCFLVIAQGCTTVNLYTEFSLTSEDRLCRNWLETIEAKLREYDIYDPGTVEVEGFPQLRVNRFLASLSDRINSEEDYAVWLEQMRSLDAASKKHRLDNLPPSESRQLLAQISTAIGDSFDQALEKCGKRLNKHNLDNPEHRKILLEQANVPDSYQDWKRVIGLYPVARYFARIGIDRLHRDLNASFKVPINKLPVQGKLIRYIPPVTKPLVPGQITEIFKSAYAVDNPLGIPMFPPLQLQALIEYFAPIWEIDTVNDNDKLGSVNFGSHGHPRVETSQPKVYATQGYTRWHGKVLLQLIYQIWLPAREKTSFFDLYGGTLDSVIWRVTLSPDGIPMAFDSIHGCGCYYLLFPGQGYRAIPSNDGTEPVLSPTRITAIPPGSRLVLRLENRTHYLQQIAFADNSSKIRGLIYGYQDLEKLRSLTLSNGTKRSLYSEDGLIDASTRAERFLFWPYGIASPGAMREWGTHAIAFIGKRHFDDPFLLENLIGKDYRFGLMKF
jgi:hypothetical protein